MSDYMNEVKRLLAAVEAKAFQLAHGVCSFDESREARAALLAHIQRGAVPEGYVIAPAFLGYALLGIGQYVLHNCPRTDDASPSLVIAIATEAEKAGRQVGELQESQQGEMIHPDRIAVRIDFKSVAALDALEQQLRFLREDSFPDSPAPEEVPMPQGYAEHPTDYTGQIWIESQMRTYGLACRAAGEAAGYVRGLRDAVRDAERYRWLRRHFAIVGTDNGAVFHALNLPTPTHIAPDAAIELDASIDAALREGVKP